MMNNHNNAFNNSDPWSESDGYNNGAEFLQETISKFLKSTVWDNICTYADDGCPDSLQAMEDMSIRISSIIFYMEQDIESRVAYETKEINNLINILNS